MEITTDDLVKIFTALDDSDSPIDFLAKASDTVRPEVLTMPLNEVFGQVSIKMLIDAIAKSKEQYELDS